MKLWYLFFLCVDYGEDDDDDDEEDYLKPDSDSSPTSTGDATHHTLAHYFS